MEHIYSYNSFILYFKNVKKGLIFDHLIYLYLFFILYKLYNFIWVIGLVYVIII